MRFGMLATAALTLGITSALPSFSKADHVRDDRDRQVERLDRDHRDVEVRRDVEIRRDVEVRRDFHRDVIIDRRPVFVRDRAVVCDPVVVTTDVDYGVQLCDVPVGVIGSLNHQGFGRVEAVQFVRRDGNAFYRFRVENGRRGCMDVRIGLDGCILGVAAAL